MLYIYLLASAHSRVSYPTRICFGMCPRRKSTGFNWEIRYEVKVHQPIHYALSICVLLLWCSFLPFLCLISALPVLPLSLSEQRRTDRIESKSSRIYRESPPRVRSARLGTIAMSVVIKKPLNVILKELLKKFRRSATTLSSTSPGSQQGAT